MYIPTSVLVELGTVAAALMGIIALVTWVSKIIKNVINPIQELRTATKSSLKYSIVRAHKDYTNKGEISAYSLSCLIEMAELYERLGGNGFVQELLTDLKMLHLDNHGQEGEQE